MIQSPPKVVDTHWNHKRKCKCISHRHTPTLWVEILKARKKTKEVVVKEEEEVEEEEEVNNILDKEATNIGRQSACSQFVLMKVSRKERDWIAIRLILSSLSSLSPKRLLCCSPAPPNPTHILSSLYSLATPGPQTRCGIKRKQSWEVLVLLPAAFLDTEAGSIVFH